MREPRIYVDLALKCEISLSLVHPASHHISKVLRMKSGQHLWLFNGVGGCYRAEILEVNKREVEVRVLEFRDENRESSLEITLVQGVSRTQHMDYTLQKAVELGVSNIVPIITDFSNVRLEDKSEEKKMIHWQRVIISACEQCGRNLLPKLGRPVSFGHWLASDNNGLKLLLHPDATESLSSIKTCKAAISLLSGPEGGLSPEEVEQAIASDYVPVALGPRILRTETAALAAISVCQTLWGDMG